MYNYPPSGSAFPGVATAVQRSSLLSKVMGMLTFSFVFALAGGYVGAKVPGLFIPALILEFMLLIALFFVRNNAAGLPCLYGFTFCSGVTTGPLIAAYIARGMVSVVGQAVAMTAVMTVCLAVYAATTKRDFTNMGGVLLIATLGLVIGGIALIFFRSPLGSAVLSTIGVIVFSLWMIYDVQRAKSMEDTVGNAIMITVSIYLDILNLFLFLLQLLGIFGGDDRD